MHIKNMKENKDLSFSWGISKTKELESLHKSINLENEWKIYEYHKNRQRILPRILNKILPDFKNMFRIVKLRFGVVPS